MNTDVDLDKVEDLMWDFFTDIPHSWYDVDFTKDVQKAFTMKKVNNRPDWGGVPLSDETCRKYKIEIEKKIPVINIYVLKNAIINLLHRRDMLVRKKKIEYSTGKNLVDTLDNIEDIHDDFDDMLMSDADKKIKEEIEELEKQEGEEDKSKSSND